MATLYQQQSAEAAALYYQSFLMAEFMLHAELENSAPGLKRAIITDIDETCLDNSPYEAKCILENISYPEQWDKWVNSAAAMPLPGSLGFFNIANRNGVEIFYITNRREKYRESTLINLQRFNFPYADNEHLLMRTDESSKESRRKSIFDEYRVIMLLGDNIEDFHAGFEGKSNEERKEQVDKLKNNFGRRFIVFPNAMYGSWENNIYEGKTELSSEEKAGMRYDALKSF